MLKHAEVEANTIGGLYAHDGERSPTVICYKSVFECQSRQIRRNGYRDHLHCQCRCGRRHSTSYSTKFQQIIQAHCAALPQKTSLPETRGPKLKLLSLKLTSHQIFQACGDVALLNGREPRCTQYRLYVPVLGDNAMGKRLLEQRTEIMNCYSLHVHAKAGVFSSLYMDHLSV